MEDSKEKEIEKLKAEFHKECGEYLDSFKYSSEKTLRKTLTDLSIVPDAMNKTLHALSLVQDALRVLAETYQDDIEDLEAEGLTVQESYKIYIEIESMLTKIQDKFNLIK